MVHHIKIAPKPGTEDKLSAGFNTQVFLDGKPLNGARFVKFEVAARKVAKVTIELYARVEIDAVADLEVVEVKKITPTMELRKLKSKKI